MNGLKIGMVNMAPETFVANPAVQERPWPRIPDCSPTNLLKWWRHGLSQQCPQHFRWMLPRVLQSSGLGRTDSHWGWHDDKLKHVQNRPSFITLFCSPSNIQIARIIWVNSSKITVFKQPDQPSCMGSAVMPLYNSPRCYPGAWGGSQKAIYQ